MTDDSKESAIEIDQAAFVAPSAALFGRVRLEEGSSVWFNSVIRSEHRHVHVGRFSNIQDLVMVHVGAQYPTIVGNYCSITHKAVLHGCTVEDFCLIGIGSTLMDGVVVGKGSIVAGHTFLPEGTVIPPGSVVMGSPGKVVRERDSSIANLANALLYHRNATAYAKGDHRAWVGISPADFKKEAEAMAKQLQIA